MISDSSLTAVGSRAERSAISLRIFIMKSLMVWDTSCCQCRTIRDRYRGKNARNDHHVKSQNSRRQWQSDSTARSVPISLARKATWFVPLTSNQMGKAIKGKCRSAKGSMMNAPPPFTRYSPCIPICFAVLPIALIPFST